MPANLERSFRLYREGDPYSHGTDPGLTNVQRQITPVLSQTLPIADQITALVGVLVGHVSIQVHVTVTRYILEWNPITHQWEQICIGLVVLTIADPGVNLAVLEVEDREVMP
ncbi:MAG: hypothetical protein K8S98_04495 [Planctomycetes bacterium]|nr:hypothetical protein [Planctomycetota bacterium]